MIWVGRSTKQAVLTKINLGLWVADDEITVAMIGRSQGAVLMECPG